MTLAAAAFAQGFVARLKDDLERVEEDIEHLRENIRSPGVENIVVWSRDLKTKTGELDELYKRIGAIEKVRFDLIFAFYFFVGALVITIFVSGGILEAGSLKDALIPQIAGVVFSAVPFLLGLAYLIGAARYLIRPSP